ncbi:MAG: hypothetical protein PH343_04790 [Nitrospira sp.]|nr:hypothetical protein [Nitrospira sp.]
MEKIIGYCGLCKKQRKLCESHLIPKSIYKIVVNKSLSTSPVLIKGGKEDVSSKTSKQVKAHFLCINCEEILTKHGEDYVLRYTYRDASKFKLQEILNGLKPEFEMDNSLVFSGNKIQKIKICHFVHFAAGVFWKASAGRWNFLNTKLSNNQLGKKYEKQFREFLLGVSQFPENAVLTMSVSNEKEPFPIVIFPQYYKYEGYFQHRFYIPGIEFILWVGNLVPESQKNISISHSAGGAFFFECLDNSPLLNETKGYLRNKGIIVEPKGR